MSGKVCYREVQKSDNVALAAMIRETFYEFDAPKIGTVFSDPTTDDLFTLFTREGSLLLVALIDGEVVGCGGYFPTEGLPHRCVEFVKFYLSKTARDKGIGWQIMNRSLQQAKLEGYKSVYLESLPVFTKAIKIYQAAGFKSLSAPLGNSGHGGCNVWMLLTL